MLPFANCPSREHMEAHSRITRPQITNPHGEILEYVQFFVLAHKKKLKSVLLSGKRQIADTIDDVIACLQEVMGVAQTNMFTKCSYLATCMCIFISRKYSNAL